VKPRLEALLREVRGASAGGYRAPQNRETRMRPVVGDERRFAFSEPAKTVAL